MKTILLKPMLNPAFKITQPLPVLPEGFVARHAWAARPFNAVTPPRESRFPIAARCRSVLVLESELHAQSARLVA
jgi:hypothetical protein